MAIPKEEVNKRIRHVVSLSKEIPWYARKYKELGIDPDKIKSPEDLLKAYQKGLHTTPADLPELVYYKHPEARGPFYTSGTTGKPKEIWLNPDDEKRIIPQFERCFKRVLTSASKVLNCLPKEPAISGYMTNITLSALGSNFQHIPAQEIRENVERFLKKYKEFNPTHLMGLTTFAYRLPLLFNSLRIENVDLALEHVLVGAEPSSIERRKTIGEELSSMVYDVYASSENGMIAYEAQPFTDEHLVTYPETLVFVVKDKNEISEGDIGDVIVTNLYDPSERPKPCLILLNYKIGDQARCIKKHDGIVTAISSIRREVAYLAGAKLDPTEIEACIEELGEYKKELTGEYCIINYYDKERRAVGEIRIESKKRLEERDKELIGKSLREKIYSINIPVKTSVEITGDAKLLINVTDPGELYKGYEHYIKPGKPKRLITLS